MAEATLDRALSATAPALPATLLLAASDPPELAAQLDAWLDAGAHTDAMWPSQAAVPGAGPARLAVVDVNPRRLELARKVLAQGRPWRGRNGVWFEPRGLLGDGGRLGFVFPGVEPTFEPRVDDVADHFELHTLAEPLRPDGGSMSALERQSRGIIAVGRLLHRVLADLGVRPDVVAGHSLGEWSGELATGVVADDLIDTFIDRLEPGSVEVADVAYVALGCGADVARELIDGLGHTVVSHDNCPQQSVVCGTPDEIRVVAERCRQRSVLMQQLPFRSGFHSPMFAMHIPAYRAAFGEWPLRAPTIPLWSATTCRPYPTDVDELKVLAERHLLEPVRFRELVLALHDDGARVFVQVGVGALTGFIDDTLRDRDAVAIAANTPKRSGLEQLTHLVAGLWVEGRDVALDRLAAPLVEPALPELEAPMVVAPMVVAPTSEPIIVWQRRFALDVEPAWADHAMFRQREGWPWQEDRFPLVPMTGIVEILMESAAALHPGMVPIAVEDVAAFRYLVVAPPTEATMRATQLGADAAGRVRVKVAIDGHARATIVLAAAYPAAPEAPADRLVNARPSHIRADRLYADRHMFHGPAYQGVVEFPAVADNGSQAVIRTPAAPGALLDNAGQVMGHWLSAHAEDGRMVLPTSIEQIEFFGPHPAPGTDVDCTVITHLLDERALRCDLTLSVGDRLWCRITAWEDRRFATDALVFEALLWPERIGMSVEHHGYTLVTERWLDAATRDVIMRRYLGRDERADYERHHPLAQRQFLLGRVAVKDAVRRWLWAHGYGPLFPAEIVVANEPSGRPVARGPYLADLRVSLAHVDGAAVAVVADGVDVGTDIEKVERRRADFERLVLTPREQSLVPPDGYGRDAWLTCLWAVKEAAAKATGRGLQGRPKDFEVTERRATSALVAERWVSFARIAAGASPAASKDGGFPEAEVDHQFGTAAPPGASPAASRTEHVVAWTSLEH